MTPLHSTFHSAASRLRACTLRLSCLGVAACLAAGCGSELDDTRIPAFSVQINLTDPGRWNVYGVSAYGQANYFVRQSRIPANFPYTETTYTGFGGVLIIMGMNPFLAGEMAPLAYDMACPVECDANIRVAIDPDTFEAVCPVCDSHYDVTMGAGAPIAGPALTGSVKYGLQRYSVIPGGGGYMITR